MASGRDGFAVLNRQREVRIALPGLRKFLGRVREELGLAETEAVICLVTDAEMARMNEKYRQKRGPTDVLSFPAEKQSMRRSGGTRSRLRAGKKAARPGGGYLGDIAISAATARRNAKEHGREFPMELRILMLHGVLHLLGYDHETDGGEMQRLEMKWRRRFGLA
jgi:probable rRNA maturation factor